MDEKLQAKIKALKLYSELLKLRNYRGNLSGTNAYSEVHSTVSKSSLRLAKLETQLRDLGYSANELDRALDKFH